MTESDQRKNPVIDGPLIPTFLRFVIPSALSLLAISTASVVDGIFVGRYVGSDALAAVNLMIPIFSFLFGLALMLAVGGAVKAGHALGQGNNEHASSALKTALISVTGLTLGLLLLINLFDETFFRILGADASLQGHMRTYFRALSPALIIQFSGLVLYYFIRADGRPGLGTTALLIGAGCNIFFDYLLVSQLNWGLQGAALATGVAQVVQLIVLLTYFVSSKRRLKWQGARWSWRDLKSMAANGASEWVNECSVCLLLFAMNWMLIQRSGNDAVAAFSVINYIIFVSLMLYYGIIDAMHVLFSQNIGAKNWSRVRDFFYLAATVIIALSIVNALSLQIWGSHFIGWFLEASAESPRAYAANYLVWVWPLFLVSGVNVLITAFLTSLEKAKISAALSLLKGILLPVGLGLLLFFTTTGIPVIVALPIAEWMTVVVALVCLSKHWPNAMSLNIASTKTSSLEAHCKVL